MKKFRYLTSIFLAIVLLRCHTGEKKTEPTAGSSVTDTAYLRERLTDPTPRDSVTEFGSSEGDADKEVKNQDN